MLQDNVWPRSFEKAVQFRTPSPQCVEMTRWFDVPIPIFDPRSVCIAPTEWALRMAIFPFLLCDLMIAVDIHEVFYVVIWLSSRSFDPLGRLDSRRRWRSSLVRTSTWVSKRIVLQISPGGWGKTDIFMYRFTPIHRIVDGWKNGCCRWTAPGYTVLPRCGPSSYGDHWLYIVDKSWRKWFQDLYSLKLYWSALWCRGLPTAERLTVSAIRFNRHLGLPIQFNDLGHKITVISKVVWLSYNFLMINK